MKLLSLITLVALFSSSASAITVYTDRAAFLAALGGATLLEEDFESFSQDESFRTSTVDVGDFTIEQTGADQDFRNTIDVQPLEFGGSEVNNGSKRVSAYVDSSPATGIKLTYDSPITAFGADISGVDLGGIAYQVNMQALATFNTGGVDQFYGFIADAPITMLQFIGVGGNEGFSFDNIVAASDTEIPEPFTAGLVLAGLAGAAARRKSVA